MLRDAAYDFSAGGVDQPGQFFQMLGDVPGVGRTFPRRSDQHYPFNWIANWNQRSDRKTFLELL